MNILDSIRLKINIYTIWRLQIVWVTIQGIFKKKVPSLLNAMLEQKPLVYSCSGCSGAAQMANYLAVQLDRREMAEMSCIAGVGGNIKKRVRTAKSGREIIVIDGCPLACARACLNNYSIKPDYHFELTRFGVNKRLHEDFSMMEAGQVFHKIESILRFGRIKRVF